MTVNRNVEAPRSGEPNAGALPGGPPSGGPAYGQPYASRPLSATQYGGDSPAAGSAAAGQAEVIPPPVQRGPEDEDIRAAEQPAQPERPAQPDPRNPGAGHRAGGATPGGRFARLVRGRPDDPRWVRPALLALLAATAVLYLWDLGASGNANSFYAAAVQAGTLSWKAMFFGSLDSSNFITVDKPPASLWMMALSGRIFGFSSWSMLVPNALCGVATVGLLYATVRRVAGPVAGLLAGVLCALTPVAVLMFRFNNPDALLVLLLVVGAYAVTRALEAASWRWLVAAGVAVGFAFLTKMMQAFLVVPAFGLAYLIAAPTGWWRRVGGVLAGVGGILVGAGWWVLATDLWPKSSRPYIGGSEDNSVLGLAFGYNGLGRIFGESNGPGGGGGGRGNLPGGQAALTEIEQYFSANGGPPGGGEFTMNGPGGGGGGGGFGGATGIDRMFGDNFGDQISWLLPAALVLLVGGLWATRRAPRTDRARAGLVLWGCWLLVTGLTFSYMEGIVHEYYSVALAPAIAGTIAIGLHELWRARGEIISRVFLAAGIAAASIWPYVLLGRNDEWQGWLRLPVLVAGLVGAVAVLAGPLLLRVGAVAARAGQRVVRRTAVALAVVVAFGALAAPAGYALETASQPHTGSIPLAGPSGGGMGGLGRMGGGPGIAEANGGQGFPGGGQGFPGGGEGFPGGGQGFPGGGTTGNDSATGNSGTTGNGGATGNSGTTGNGGAGGNSGTGAGGGMRGGGMGEDVSDELGKLLAEGAEGYRWVAATSTSQSAASMELASGGSPVMAMGGWSGSDPAITLEQFKQYVNDGEIHYFIAGGMGGGTFTNIATSGTGETAQSGGTGGTQSGANGGTQSGTGDQNTGGDAATGTGGMPGFGGGGGGFGGNSEISTWVTENFTALTVGGQTVYDLTQPVNS
ncbi:4-amino-4-deoxy-L-arabinose transferase [Parafrankia irregularis]|uniref:4-amino-4-deoxy-L-arabinose transferase n=1 Tax=Parafrankia irregularis TaxID=795642 RepID=A0A0S4QIK1_9ACTN|nr:MULTISPECIES: glycosyltransferase family 39 protein [Parafrankia]MBE3204059.1 glycosyltransferase family 39 protein [Parafrankia sp. CH37]CUU55065.1 4-amino-4-deoxy-L-arabinose transferase [Parafrankia irregularis]